MNGNASFIDNCRTVCLCVAGCEDYVAATAIAADGSEHLVLAQLDAIGNPDVGYDPNCSAIAHEQLGALPLEYVRRITISQRTHRCGAETKAGTPCRIPVRRRGDVCSWHRTPTHRKEPA